MKNIFHLTASCKLPPHLSTCICLCRALIHRAALPHIWTHHPTPELQLLCFDRLMWLLPPVPAGGSSVKLLGGCAALLHVDILQQEYVLFKYHFDKSHVRMWNVGLSSTTESILRLNIEN